MEALLNVISNRSNSKISHDGGCFSLITTSQSPSSKEENLNFTVDHELDS